MNAARRKQLLAITASIQVIRNLIEATQTDLETIKDAEQEAFDNIPESLQDGDAGEKILTAVSDMDDIDGLFTDMVEQLDEITDSIDNIRTA